MKRVLLVLLSFTLVGCVTMPGTISERVSGFDKTTEITMEPACVKINFTSCFELGLYKTSKMDADKAILTVVVSGANNFSPKDSLQFNIDGSITTFESIDAMTNIETDQGVYNSVVYIPASNSSSKRYEITKDFIKRLIEAKKVWVKIVLSREYVEGEFSLEDPMSARPSFRKFYNKVWGAK